MVNCEVKEPKDNVRFVPELKGNLGKLRPGQVVIWSQERSEIGPPRF